MREPVTYVLRLPKHVKIDSVDITSIPIDESWLVAVKENHQTIAETTLKNARRARY
jgi:hypothetical protein